MSEFTIILSNVMLVISWIFYVVTVYKLRQATFDLFYKNMDLEIRLDFIEKTICDEVPYLAKVIKIKTHKE